MNKKILYLTRSYYPYQKNGGAIMRTGAVESLRKLGWNITVIIPNYETDELILKEDMWKIPFKGRHLQKLSSFYERLGIYEDYLDKWVNNALEFLKDKIYETDIVFATSGGELGMIKLGSLLKNIIRCKFVINFRDPLNYGYMNGLKKDRKFHISRENAHEKYIRNADLIITSSEYYANILKSRFNYISDKVNNNHFGYVKEIDLSQFKKNQSNKLRIAYSGIMSGTQKPELLYSAFLNGNFSDKVELYFIGNKKKYCPLNKIDDQNVYFIDFMPHDTFLKFMCENIDVGFVSLTNDYYGACVPSKIYEYINLGLPILGVLPDGDARNIIKKNRFGIVSRYNYNNTSTLTNNIQNLLENKNLEKYKNNILKNRKQFSMLKKIEEVNDLLNKIS